MYTMRPDSIQCDTHCNVLLTAHLNIKAIHIKISFDKGYICNLHESDHPCPVQCMKKEMKDVDLLRRFSELKL